MMTTRTRVTIASSILRMFPLVVLAVGELDLVQLGDALDDVGDLLSERLAIPREVTSGVLDGVMEQAPAMAVESIFNSASTCATSRMDHIGLTLARFCPHAAAAERPPPCG